MGKNDDSFTTYFEHHEHTDDAVDTLKEVVELYTGFVAEVAADHAQENEHETVLKTDVETAVA